MINEYLKKDEVFVKELLINAMEAFNISDYLVKPATKIKVMEFIDKDKCPHLILVDNNKLTMKEDLRLLNNRLALFYNSIYNGGLECINKAKIIRKLCSLLVNDNRITIDDMTLISFTFILNPNIDNMCRMSQFWYNVYQISIKENIINI